MRKDTSVIPNNHFRVITLGILLFFALPLMETCEAQLRRGIVEEKPNHGVFVETDYGFMVPYKEQIPGTEVSFEMIPIPASRVMIGSPEQEQGRHVSEGPQFNVDIEPYWIGKYEVTWKEYWLFLELNGTFKAFEESGIRPITDDDQFDVVTAPSTLYDPSFTYDGGDGPDEPAVTMTQYASKQYTKWLSLLLEDFYRLPTEAEWENACRAGTTTAYSFGETAENIEEFAWLETNSEGQRHRVGLKRPNGWGLYDMHGNAAEWVLDGHVESGYQVREGAVISSINAIHWPTAVSGRVARGGSWEMDADELRSASRLASNDQLWKEEDPDAPTSPWWYTSYPATGVGMRIVRPLFVPMSPDDRAKYWDADHEEIRSNVQNRIVEQGRGARGVVDPGIVEAIGRLISDQLHK